MTITAVQPVESSFIDSIGHDPVEQVLVLNTKDGKTLKYSGVDTETHAALMAAPSIGAAYSALIRGKFDRVSDDDDD